MSQLESCKPITRETMIVTRFVSVLIASLGMLYTPVFTYFAGLSVIIISCFWLNNTDIKILNMLTLQLMYVTQVWVLQVKIYLSSFLKGFNRYIYYIASTHGKGARHVESSPVSVQTCDLWLPAKRYKHIHTYLKKIFILAFRGLELSWLYFKAVVVVIGN